jgi:ATP-dependent Clp protease ATP-binding subunit ClpX
VAGRSIEVIQARQSVDVERSQPPGIITVADVQQNFDDDELLAVLPKVAAASAQPERQLALLVGKARARRITWARIGAAMGMTRQAAWERFSGEE